ncbi:sensor histidine kinase [Falsiporphyromonas endometrii]|uniref:histidine kinase n=1 Tax=Falsiporphyromonas endometrii TaxID=1387297 RepID=A0ABV9KA59_9PORP
MGIFKHRYIDNRLLTQIIFIVVAAAIVGTSLFVSSKLVENIAHEERQKMEIWAMSARLLASDDNGEPNSIDLVLKVMESNKTIPAILCNENDSIVSFNNIEIGSRDSLILLQDKLHSFKDGYEPITIDMGSAGMQYLYYSDSSTLRHILLFPYVQIAVMIIFILVAIWAVLATKRSEQNRIWAGLSKETAHQLGTPISSLMAWVEILRSGMCNDEIIGEIEKDTQRLKMIADRFQKIGSIQTLAPINMQELIKQSISYMEPRISGHVSLSSHLPDTPINIMGADTLLSWVIENLIKNAVDAMQGKGHIEIRLSIKGKNMLLDISDSGKGLEKGQFKSVFRPGYTTKKRGWGLGLSLAKRIIEEYHNGKIFVLASEIGKGTTFRIILPLKTDL